MSAHPTDIPTVEGLRNTTPLPDEEREKLAKMIEPSGDEGYPPSWSDDKILGNRLARAWAAAMVRGGPVEGIDPQVRRSPLPEEIAGLIERLDRWMPADRYSATELMNESAAALRAQAQENERVTNELATLVAEFNARGMERDGLRAKCATLEEHIRELKAERDAKVP